MQPWPLSHQDTKAFLFEAPVRSEDLCHGGLSHRVHSDAVGQAIVLVATPLVEVESREKAFSCLGRDSDLRMIEKPSGEHRRSRSYQGPARGEAGEEFHQNLVYGEETNPAKPLARPARHRGPRIGGPEDGDPVCRIRKYGPHRPGWP